MLKLIKDKISFISGIFFVVLSIILFYEASTLSPFGAVFPYAMTTILTILSIILIVRSFKFEIKVINQTISFVKIPLLILVFFMWIYFLERAGFIMSSLVSFNLIVLINSGFSLSLKKFFIYDIGKWFYFIIVFWF